MSMKREKWKNVYVPRDGQLEVRVRFALDALEEKPARGLHRKRVWVLAAAAVLALLSVAALASGVFFSRQASAKNAAARVLQKQYGFTPELEAFFACEVSEDGKTVTFTPNDGNLGERLGVYTVSLTDGGGEASWSYDGMTETAEGAVWDVEALEKAVERKHAGEEWYEILNDAQALAVKITAGKAEELARQAVQERYGADALAGFGGANVNLYVDEEQAAADGHGIRRYSVSFQREEDGCYYVVGVYGDDGGVFRCDLRREEQEPQRPAIADALRGEEARERAQVTLEEAVSLSKQALAGRYGLTAEQVQRLEWEETYDGVTYRMEGDTPIISCYFWLWQGEDEMFTPGDGLYTVEMNALTGVVDGTYYDSGAVGNG